MAKKSHRRHARAKKHHAGCIWGLLSMLDFRHRHFTRKLLKDKKHGTGGHLGTGHSRSKLNLLSNPAERHKDIDDINEEEAGRIGFDTVSIKTLMEEELLRENSSKKISNAEVEHPRSDLQSQFHLTDNHKQISENSKATCNLHANDLRAFASLDPSWSTYPNPMEKSSIDLELPALMSEYCVDNRRSQEKQVDCLTKINPSPYLKHISHSNYSYLYEHPELAQKHSILQKALDNEATTLKCQRFIDIKQLNGNGIVHESKDFMDALETLNSNKELLLKLLQDPDSLLLKHIQDFQNSQAGKLAKLESSKNFEGGELLEEAKNSGQYDQSINHKRLKNQIRQYPFRKIDESNSTKLSKKGDNSKVMDRIVVLKPSLARIQNFSDLSTSNSSSYLHQSFQHQKDNGRVSSHFSLKEIRRRLRHAIGEGRKEQHSITTDGILHKIPSGFHDSGDKWIARDGAGINLPGKNSSPTDYASRRDNQTKPRASQPNIKDEFISTRTTHHRRPNSAAFAQSLSRESILKEETGKRLSEMLCSVEKDQVSTTREVSKTLGRILPLPGYHFLYPRLAPGRDKEPDLLSQQMRLSSMQQLTQENDTNLSSPSSQNLETPPSTPLIDAEWQSGELNSEGTMENVEITDNMRMEESRHLDVSSESDDNKFSGMGEDCNKERSYMQPGLEPYEEMPQLMNLSVPASPDCLPIHKLELPQCIIENPEQPSPASVLEPLFSDDIISPPSATTEQTEVPLRPQQSRLKEHDNGAVVVTPSVSKVNLRTIEDEEVANFKYVKTVLEASGLSCDQFLEWWYLSDQLLDPSLFDELEVSYSLIPDNPKLIFDCIGEVLVEIHERISSGSPWMSYIQPYVRPLPVGGKFIQEVFKGVDQHLQLQVPCTLEQIVEKDMNVGTWMNLRFEIESIVIEMGDSILEDLMEETVLKLWVQSFWSARDLFHFV